MMNCVICLTQYICTIFGSDTGINIWMLILRMIFSTLSGTENHWVFFFNPRPVKHLFALSQPTQSFCIGIFCFLARGELCVFFSEILVKCTVSGSSGVWLPLMTRGDECQARHQAATSQAQGGPRRAGEHVRDDKPVQVCIRTFRQLQHDDTRPRTI